MSEQTECVIKTHDYTKEKCCWGWNIVSLYKDKDDEKKYNILGIGNGIKVGDLLKLSSKGTFCLLKVEKIEYSDNPTDMYDASAVLMERTDL